ncbi:hypothetical protein L1987_36170 [Smallanthus sonchifolius]|uniref:Uncharacterized protein n=1 Tax=Smallanthus sonchifolius TaxID=185202 RepID=A0ACB9HDH3_9ASTR|nr:hypothetical protein L1987_36170 [Smallanthus sonchifolius]
MMICFKNCHIISYFKTFYFDSFLTYKYGEVVERNKVKEIELNWVEWEEHLNEIEAGRVELPHYLDDDDDDNVVAGMGSKRGKKNRGRNGDHGLPMNTGNLLTFEILGGAEGLWERRLVQHFKRHGFKDDDSKYYLRQNAAEKKRCSIHDITIIDAPPATAPSTPAPSPPGGQGGGGAQSPLTPALVSFSGEGQGLGGAWSPPQLLPNNFYGEQGGALELMDDEASLHSV